MSKEKKETAVQKLITFYSINGVLSPEFVAEILELEKQQIIDSANHGANFENSPFANAEEYYKETYKVQKY